jgi:hypothetical protein
METIEPIGVAELSPPELGFFGKLFSQMKQASKFRF